MEIEQHNPNYTRRDFENILKQLLFEEYSYYRMATDE